MYSGSVAKNCNYLLSHRLTSTLSEEHRIRKCIYISVFRNTASQYKDFFSLQQVNAYLLLLQLLISCFKIGLVGNVNASVIHTQSRMLYCGTQRAHAGFLLSCENRILRHFQNFNCFEDYISLAIQTGLVVCCHTEHIETIKM